MRVNEHATTTAGVHMPVVLAVHVLAVHVLAVNVLAGWRMCYVYVHICVRVRVHSGRALCITPLHTHIYAQPLPLARIFTTTITPPPKHTHAPPCAALPPASLHPRRRHHPLTQLQQTLRRPDPPCQSQTRPGSQPGCQICRAGGS
jgi:hypothetical protein